MTKKHVERWSLCCSVSLLRLNAFLMWTYFQLNNLVHGQQRGLSRIYLMGRKSTGGKSGTGNLNGHEHAYCSTMGVLRSRKSCGSIVMRNGQFIYVL